MTFHDHFSTASDAYRFFRPRYPAELFAYLAESAPSLGWAWDCGCGNGQASVALVNHFNKVTATDASEAQIKQAEPANNLDYRVSRAEVIDAPNESLDLITVAQAIHWFNHAEFFEQVTRTLKPDGILAAWGYQLMYTDTELDQFIEQFHSKIVGPYWPPERALLDNGYSQIQFPFERISSPTFYMRIHWSFDHLLGYLNTWSAVKRYQVEVGNNPVEEYRAVLKQFWGDTSLLKEIYWPIILYIGRKPAGV